MRMPPYDFKRLGIQCIMWTYLGLFGIFFPPHKKLIQILYFNVSAFAQFFLCSPNKPCVPSQNLSSLRAEVFSGEQTSFESKFPWQHKTCERKQRALNIYIQLYYSLLSSLGALQNFHFWVTHTFKINQLKVDGLHLSVQIFISTVRPAISYSLLFMDLLSEKMNVCFQVFTAFYITILFN